MAEPVLRDRPSPEPIRFPEPVPGAVPAAQTALPPAAIPAPEPVPRATRRVERPPRQRAVPPRVPASQALLEQLQRRWEELKARTESTVSSGRRTLTTEINEDVDYVKIRARYYHERQPLEAVGAVAASAFVLGMIFGFWRR